MIFKVKVFEICGFNKYLSKLNKSLLSIKS